jgi:hypothetical protein
MTIKSLYPTVLPSLNLDFANLKKLDPRVTYTRASTGTFVNENGLVATAASGAARFDHDPATGKCLGLLVEEARTNLFLQSNEFGTTWTNTNSSETSLSGTAPDGTNTAWELKDTSDASSVVHALNQSIDFISGTTYTASCWMKAGVLSEGGFTFPLAAFTFNLSARVSLSTGAVIAVSSGVTATTQQFPNGWWRVSATATATATASASMQVRIMNGGVAYIGTGTGTILIWGAQLEAGAFPTSYIPTVASTVTRAADVASMTGTNFSSWNNPTTGTFVSNFRAQTPATFSINGAGGSSDRLIFIEDSGVRIRQQLCTAGPVVYDQTPTTVYSKTAANEFAFALASGSQASALNGTVGGAGTATSIFTPTSMQIGRETAFGNYLNGSLARLAYYPVRLPDAQLQALTAT